MNSTPQVFPQFNVGATGQPHPTRCCPSRQAFPRWGIKAQKQGLLPIPLNCQAAFTDLAFQRFPAPSRPIPHQPSRFHPRIALGPNHPSPQHQGDCPLSQGGGLAPTPGTPHPNGQQGDRDIQGLLKKTRPQRVRHRWGCSHGQKGPVKCAERSTCRWCHQTRNCFSWRCVWACRARCGRNSPNRIRGRDAAS